MADKTPQQQVQELKDLVVNYAKQETVDPIKSIGLYVGWAIAGALMFGTGAVFIGVGLLRFLQTSMPEWGDGYGKSSWFPYFVVIVALAATTAIVVKKMMSAVAAGPKDAR